MAVSTGVCHACLLRAWGRLQTLTIQPLPRHFSTTRALDAVSRRVLSRSNIGHRPLHVKQPAWQRAISASSRPHNIPDIEEEEGRSKNMAPPLRRELEKTLRQQGIDDPAIQAQYIRKLAEDGLELGFLQQSVNQLQSDKSLGNKSLDQNVADNVDLETIRNRLPPADVARAARERFGDRLPQGALRPEEYKAYERLYGTPQTWIEQHELTPEDVDAAAHEDLRRQEEAQDQLQQKGSTGAWEEVEDSSVGTNEEDWDSEDDLLIHSSNPDDMRLEWDIEKAMTQESAEGQEITLQPTDEDSTGVSRTHPFTREGLSGTRGSVNLPTKQLVLPTRAMLDDINNAQFWGMAENLFGGKGLPCSTTTSQIGARLAQRPIPLTARQARMKPAHSNLWMAVLAPGMYASIMGVLVELRKRLGSDWLTSMLLKPDGPKILDAGSGGVGVLAWRQMLKAEWARMLDDPLSPAHHVVNPHTAPMGKATVLAGSDTLRNRASDLLDNTTFVPRLPDYVHVADKTSEQRKQFDVVIAPHTLWAMKEDKDRRQHIENLWALTSARGGVLVILEKGVAGGFEVVADAREHLLKNLFAPAADQPERSDVRRIHAGAIVAPCTNHETCPMYPVPGVSKQRQDYCHFAQRFTRPDYYQRALGALRRNYEDARYSYIAVRKGHQEKDEASSLSGEAATLRAFKGYGLGDDDLLIRSDQSIQMTVTAVDETEPPENFHGPRAFSDEPLTTPGPSSRSPDPHSLPRIIFSPIKRHGHVNIDVCTPAGTFERWTVPRSFSKQAYHDARKSEWGDLWALGAKIRVPRKVRLSSGDGDDEDNRPKKPRTRTRKDTKDAYGDDLPLLYFE